MHSLEELNLAGYKLTTLPLPLGTLVDSLEKLVVEGNPLNPENVPPQYTNNTKMLLNHLYDLLNSNHDLCRNVQYY